MKRPIHGSPRAADHLLGQFMITGQLKSQVDKVWEAFWAGGIANGLTVIEQVSYLLFARRLDELHTAREKKANLTGKPIESPIFGKGQDKLRWSRFKNAEPQQMYTTFRDEVFPFIKSISEDRESAFSRFMKDAVFVIPTPGLLAKVVDMLDKIPMEDRDTKGDVYEYLLGKLAVEGRNGQFRTPRHIIRMMVDMMQPQPGDVIGDPAAGTCGFLVVAGEYLHDTHADKFHDKNFLDHYNNRMFRGSDFDGSMARIGAMNLLLHGVQNPQLEQLDSLSEANAANRENCTLVLANPPFKGSLNEAEVAKDLLQVARTKKTELLFLALFLRQLKTGGRCACIVPDGVLFGSSGAHKAIRKEIVENHRLEGIVSMPSGVFKPYAGVSTAVLIFTKTNSGGTDHVWFYDMTADGFSLDDKREPTKTNDIPDVVQQWANRDAAKMTDRTLKAFFVPVQELRDNDYDLSINRYKETEHEAIEHESPEKILDELEALEEEIMADLKELREMLD